jgi:hypothetical protein
MTIGNCSTRPELTAVAGEGVPSGVDGSRGQVDWQRMWLHAQSRDWRTLTLVPADDRTSTLEVAVLMAKIALGHGESIHVADMRELRLKHVDAFLDGTRWERSQGDRIIFATRSAFANLATIRIARATDCAILCVSLGSTSLDSARGTIEQIGRKHFLGSLLVRASTRSESPSGALSRWRPAPETRR